jgi:hypothetical protein
MSLGERVIKNILSKQVDNSRNRKVEKDIPFEKREFEGEYGVRYTGKEIVDTSNMDNGLLEKSARQIKVGETNVVERPDYNSKQHRGSVWGVKRIK